MRSRPLPGGRRSILARRTSRAPAFLALIAIAMAVSMAASNVSLPGSPFPGTDGSSGWSGGDVGPASPGPDMNASSSDISLSDSTPRHGQSLTITVKVRNSGDQDALNVTVALYDGDDVTGTLIGDHFIDNSSSGSFDVVNLPWKATIGSHDLTLYLDTDENVTEDSEANNEATLTVVVGGVPDVRLEQGAFLASANQAGLVTLTADAINGGNATATGYRMGFYRGDPDSGGSLIGNVNLADIPAGHRTAAQVAFTASSGVYHLYARAEQTDSLDPSGNDQVDREFWFNPLIEAKAGPDMVAMAGQNLTFNGSASWSVDGAITNYTWDFGDSSTGYGAVVTHNYTNSGTTVRTLTARLTVKDGSGRSDSDPVRVYINPTGSSPPTADAGTALLGRTLETLTFDGSGSTGNITTYIWDFGDGSSSTGSSTTHEYWEDGTYTASLLVVNSQQLAAADTVIVTVTNQAPEVEPIADIDTDVGVTHDLLVLAYDPDGYIASYLWDFDDGTTSTVRDPSHAWTSDGPHLVTVNVTDNDGAFTVITFHVNVTNVVPQVDFTISGVLREGATLTVDASPTVEPGDDIVVYEWDWETDDIYDNTTGPVSYISYYRPGYYNITLRVTDGEGAVNKTKKGIYVEDVVPQASASITGARTVVEGENITFNASASFEPGDNIVLYMWDLDDDDVYELNTTEPIITPTMTKVVSNVRPNLKVLDEDGSECLPYTTYWIRYSVTNKKPLVNESVSYGVEGENTTIHVDAEEPGNDFVDFYWDFDNDGTMDAHTNVSYVDHIWYTAGNHTVWVMVTDTEHMNPDESWGAGEFIVNITDVAPRPFVEDGQADEGVPTVFEVQLRGTEENISSYHFDLDGDDVYEVETTDPTPELVFTFRGEMGEVHCKVMAIDTDGTAGYGSFIVFVHDVAPTVTGPQFMLTVEGATLTVKVNAYEPGMDIVSYGWDWDGNGYPDETTDGPEAEHIYMSPGAERIIVTALDEDGSTGSVSIQVLVANAPPVADAGTPPQTNEGEAITLSAYGSTEPGDNIVLYEWDYDGDGLFDFSTREANHTHAWDAPGTYSVVLRVTDADGTFDEDYVPVVVHDVDPVADLSVTIKTEDIPSILDASNSHDPGGIERYVWNITTFDKGYNLETTGPIIPFTFDRKVEYRIDLVVYDHEGGMAEASLTVTADQVRTLPPTVTWDVPTSAAEGEPVVFRAWADDPFPDDARLQENRQMTFSWNFGDGTSGQGDTVTHIFSRAAATPFTVKLTVIDEDDDRTGPLTANVTVSNPPPIIHPVEPIIVKGGSKGETDIDAEDVTSTGLGLTFLLADNSPEWASMEGNKLVVNPGKGVDPATYIITVRVIDVLDAESQTQVPVVVTADAEASGVTWFQLFAVMIPLLLVVLVVAVLVSRKMQPAAAVTGVASEERKEGASDYDQFFKPKKVRPVAKVATEKVDVEYDKEEPEDLYPPPAEGPVDVPEPPATVPVPEVEEPPLPSWMTPSEPAEPEEVQLPEREMEAPPATPSEWERHEEPAPDHPYRYRGKPPSEGAKFRGAGPPK